ncbi:MAG: BlaI/MecI/CopY family transcriptional regulator, partial [Cyclobacteriaceae bacterium]
MKGTHIGELEELVLLIVANLYDNAYGVLIKTEIEEQCDRKITISTVHNVLQRLQEKGFLSSRRSEPTKE